MRDHQADSSQQSNPNPNHSQPHDTKTSIQEGRLTESLVFTPTNILRMQRTIGNRAVQRLIERRSAATSVMREPDGDAEAADDNGLDAAHFVTKVKEAIAREEFVEPPTQNMDGGAFYYLDAVPTSDMLIEVVDKIGKTSRAALLSHVEEIDAPYDKRKIESALRSVAQGTGEAGVVGLNMQEAVDACLQEYIRRTAQVLPVFGAFFPAFALLIGKERTEVQDMLRNVDRGSLSLLKQRIEDAAIVPERDMVEEVINDFLGDGTNMTADDVIDVAGLGGINLTMATIYNKWGQFLVEKAREIGISTAMAAAVMGLESGGKTLNPETNKPTIRFENHVLLKEWGRDNRETFNKHFAFGKPAYTGHKWRSDTEGDWQTFHEADGGNQTLEWEVVEFTAGLVDRETAYKCMSVGAAQIMGFNHDKVGYGSATEMVEAFTASDRDNITGLFDFIVDQDLVSVLQEGDYAKFAQVYNAASDNQLTNYVRWFTSREKAYRKLTKGKAHTYEPGGEDKAE